MSQSESAPRPASRRSPKSSPGAAFSSPRSPRSSPQTYIGRRDDTQPPAHDPGGARSSVTDDGGRAEISRTSDVHDILNISESRALHPGSKTSYSTQEPREAEGARPIMGGSRPPGHSLPPFNPYSFQGNQAPIAPQPAYPLLAPSPTTGPPASIGRVSPTIGPPLHPLGVPRRILTPRSPRVTSLTRAARRAEDAQHNPLPSQPSLAGSVSSEDISPRSGPTVLGGPALRGPTQLPGVAQRAALPAPTVSPVTARSLSQPIIGHTLPSSLTTDYLYSGGKPSLPGSGSTPLPPHPPLPKEAAVPGALGEGRWSTGGLGSMPGLPWGRGLPVGESQHLLTITPQYGEEIVVPVDTHQGSKTQDQKRQKNAIASARFRSRKKEREHQLEVDNQELALRVRELETERDFYRNERNRLRDIVSRTPNISDWARGPPSPVFNRGQATEPMEEGHMAGASHIQSAPPDQLMAGGPQVRRRRGPQARSPPAGGASYVAESSIVAGAPRPQGHAHAHPPPFAYGPPESSTAEPAARRRKIEHEPRFTTPSYGPLQPTTLPPPMAPATFGANTPRHPPMSPEIARLPPLRIDQPPTASEHPPQPQPGPGQGAPPPPLPQQAQQQPSYPPSYSRSAYEPSWALAQGPQEGGQR